jgi:uncharacterized protein
MHDNDLVSNPTSNPTFAEIAERHLSRRTVLAGGLGAAAIGFLGGSALLGAAPAGARPTVNPGRRGPAIGFTAITPSDLDEIRVPEGYVATVLIPWGTPLFSDVTWKPDASNTAAEQERQVGSHHDGMHYFPLGGPRSASTRGLLVLNHEYVDPILLTPDGQLPVTFEKVQKALAAHGVTVVEVELGSSGWRHVVDSPLNRRVTGNTPVLFSGPAKDDARLVAKTPQRGTLNNCAMGYTPWNTYLACEENWDGYFGTNTPALWTRTDTDKRYGLSATGFGYRWHEGDSRFDLAVDPNEPNRYGWVVEIDPFNPSSAPVKRTALGRIKHEGATFTESRGRACVYMGDDQDKEYVYKFVSDLPWRAHVGRGESPLDHGRLYVARFNDDGSGDWLPLVWGEGQLTEANGWMSQADVLVRTREAADAVRAPGETVADRGATRMDRPEWIAENPITKDLFITMTNGTTGGVPNGERNGLDKVTAVPNANPYGNIVKLREEGDGTGTRFRWDLWMLCGDPAYASDVTTPAGSDIFGSPDGIWVDPDGRLWIQTDISNSSQNRASRGYDNIKNNQMLVADPDTKVVKRFLTGPRGCEITGVITTPDQTTMFINVQHPGESTTHWGPPPSPSNPTAVSSWPALPGDTRPRSATVVIRRVDGGKVGT